MSGAGVIAATPQQAEALRAQAAAFFQYAPQVSRAVTARFYFWDSLKRSANTYGYTIEAVLQSGVAVGAFDQQTAAAIVNDNAAADTGAKQWARVVSALDNGAAELAGRMDGNQLKLGVVMKGSLPKPLELWPLVAVIAIGGVGAWLLYDWLEVQRVEAEAARVHALTQRAVTDAVTAMANKMGPDAAKVLADALAKATQAAQQPPHGLLATLSAGAGKVVDAVTNAASDTNDALLWGLGLYFLSKYL